MKINSVTVSASVAVLLLVLLGGAIFLSNSGKVSKGFLHITVTGNSLLKQNEYFVFAALKPESPGKITAAEIRDKLLKHRYVEDVIVNTDRYGTARVEIKEKKCVGRALAPNGEFMLTAKGELIKLLPRTQNPDVPVISGIDVGVKMNNAEKEKLFTAYKIINGSGIDSAGFGSLLSELIIQENGMIFASLTGFAPVFIIDEKNLERQVAYMYNIVRSRENYKELLRAAEYIDVRYDKKIFVGGV